MLDPRRGYAAWLITHNLPCTPATWQQWLAHCATQKAA